MDKFDVIPAELRESRDLSPRMDPGVPDRGFAASGMTVMGDRGVRRGGVPRHGLNFPLAPGAISLNLGGMDDAGAKAAGSKPLGWLEEAFSAEKTIPGMRSALRKAIPLVDLPPPPVERKEGIHIAGAKTALNARVYVPFGAMENGAGLVFFHGGGFVIGDIDTHDGLCQRLAAVSGARVVSVDYRLAPEHPYPAAADDALAAFDTIRRGRLAAYGFDPDHLAVGGDSAGGTLAALVAQARRGQVRFQLLLYPLLQLVEIKKQKIRWQDGPLFYTGALNSIRGSYLKDPALAADPRVSPLFADDLKGVAPAYMLAAEIDPLNEEGLAYADRLAASGVPVQRKVVKGVPHGFLNMSRLVPKTVSAIEKAGRALADGLGRSA